MSGEAESLKARILKRYASIHAFCRAHPELKRATVYLALSGRYPGNWSRQAVKIEAALTGAKKAPETPVPCTTQSAVAEALQAIRCAHCRRLDRRECMACRDQTEREGRELFCKIFQGVRNDENADMGDSKAGS